ncbi:MAG: tape measure protein, partial [Gammaproteobacteria bacterium]|nr:tape measure protein [Gammaproteobacteria bacterium]
MSRKSDKEFLIRVRADIKQAVGELKQFSGEMKKTGADGKKAAGGVSKLEKNMNQLVLVAKVYVALKIARGLILQADAFQVLQTRIKTATKETGDYVAVSKQIYAISQRNGTELRTTTELFQSIARAAPELQATNKQVLGVVDSVSQLGIISGASKANLDAGLLQFSQGLSTGIFRAEEFNSLLENIPEVAKRIAEGMGKTTGELRNAIIAGDVLSKDVFESLQKQAGDITAEFEGIDDAVTRNETKIVSAFSRTLDAIDSVLHVTDIYNFFLNLGTYLLDGISNTINDLSFDEFNDQLDDAVFHVEDLIQRFDELKTVDFNNGLDLIDEQLINIQNELKAIVAFTPHVNILPDEQEKINVLTGQLKHLIGLRKILVDGSKNPVDQPAAEEADKSIAAIDKTIAALQEQADTFGLSNNAVTLHRLHLQGASNDQLLLAHAIVKVINKK